jgi:hypothetical protein
VAHRAGIAIPFAVNDADGGIDAVVKAVPKGAGNGLIFPPTTSYQVKAGNFPLSASALAQIEELLITVRVRNGNADIINFGPEHLA